MGRDILAGVAMGLLVAAVLWAVELVRRYIRAKGYELAGAQHAARQALAAADSYGYGSVGSMTLEDETRFFTELAAPVWQSDLEREGVPLPAWAAPEAQRDTTYGVNTGDGDQLPPLNLPPGWPRPALFPDRLDPDGPGDPDLDEKWDRLVAAWEEDGWQPTKLGTQFDADLAAEVAAWLREQDQDAARYLDRLWEDK